MSHVQKGGQVNSEDLGIKFENMRLNMLATGSINSSEDGTKYYSTR